MTQPIDTFNYGIDIRDSDCGSATWLVVFDYSKEVVVDIFEAEFLEDIVPAFESKYGNIDNFREPKYLN
jgi:hypothetical protein